MFFLCSLGKYNKSLYIIIAKRDCCLGGMSNMELINKVIYDTYNEIENSVKIENGNYIHRQIEKRDNKVFMRIKTRKLFEITTT